MKVSKDVVEALAMPVVCYGAPNMYFLFAAMRLFNVDIQGEMERPQVVLLATCGLSSV